MDVKEKGEEKEMKAFCPRQVVKLLVNIHPDLLRNIVCKVSRLSQIIQVLLCKILKLYTIMYNTYVYICHTCE